MWPGWIEHGWEYMHSYNVHFGNNHRSKVSRIHPNLRNITLRNVTPSLISQTLGRDVCSSNLLPCCHISLPYIIKEALVELFTDITYYSFLSSIYPHGWGFGWVRVRSLGFRGRVRNKNKKLWEGLKNLDCRGTHEQSQKKNGVMACKTMQFENTWGSFL